MAWATGASIIHTIVTGLLTVVLTDAHLSWLATVIALLAYLPLLWFTTITGIKRCHDIGISGWWSLSLIVPVIVLVWVFVPGNKGDNRYGPPPPPNTWGVRILGAILPVVCVIGIIAAIAIPQYKMYMDKARAAQASHPN